jgi:hypothetical protein
MNSQLTILAFFASFQHGHHEGIYMVGNVGRHQGSFKSALIGAYLASPLVYLLSNPVVYTAIVSSFVFKRTPNRPRSIVRRVAVLTVLSILYLQLWAGWFCFNCETTNNEGETVKCVDSLVDFFHSPSWHQFKNAMSELKLYIQIHGIRGLYQNLKAWAGENLEQEAYQVLGVQPNATRDEIMKQYRKLVRQWHPDKQKDESKRAEAQERFIAIVEAHQVLMKVNKN